ncbi:MAG: phosphoribosylaminoimidazolesuccinocarboxamide synthase [Planctomycetota bacterium]|nr:phosphoribosylaminoimidazolesuccinocarboxamide synthase [Planctomycetota bacterium]
MPATSPAPLAAADLLLPGLRRGKVRDVFDLPPDPATGDPRLLIVATDRISAFDVVMPTPIPGKGALLTEMAAFWLAFVRARGLCRTHLLSTDAADVPDSAFRPGGTTRDDLRGRVMIVRRARVVPIECVARGYIEGSGWKDYQRTGAICGVALPPGLRQCDALPRPIFTPATKEAFGRHDENIDFDRACAIAGRPLMEHLRGVTLAIYTEAAAYARDRGIIIADTKFEFGFESASDSGPAAIGGGADDPRAAMPPASIMLVDEALTPDSSRFWPLAGYEPGRPQRSFDKQYLREYLERLVASGAWNKQSPGPELPDEIVRATLDRYREARDRLLA